MIVVLKAQHFSFWFISISTVQWIVQKSSKPTGEGPLNQKQEKWPKSTILEAKIIIMTA